LGNFPTSKHFYGGNKSFFVFIAATEELIMKFRSIVLAFVLVSGQLFSQEIKTPQIYGKIITEESLREKLEILASDALEGRETGSRGQKMAAAFISSWFDELNLVPPVNGNFFQPVNLYTSVPGDIYINAGQKKYDNFEDVVYYGTADSGGEVITEVIFAGRGTKEDLDQLDLTGKTVLMRKSEQNYREQVAAARARNAKLIVIYNDKPEDFVRLREQWESYLSGGLLSLKKPENRTKSEGVFFVSPVVASSIMGLPLEKLRKAIAEESTKKPLTKIKAGKMAFRTGTEVKTLKSENVLGFLEGTDKKEEVLIITAHYDHIGKLDEGEGDLINNGADDDGSGTVTLMDIAKAFVNAKKDGHGPRRSILFMAVTGEEVGLLGSDYYTQFPVFPLSSTVVNLNIDMVGRRDPQHAKSAPYVYVIGADKLSSRLNQVSESINKANHKLIFDYTYNNTNHPDRLYYRSDHWNFAKNNIPVIFYFDGIHEDYHKPSDEVEKIEFDLLKLRAQTIFYTAWEIANMEDRIVPDGAK
jgi:hypothetical protein